MIALCAIMAAHANDTIDLVVPYGPGSGTDQLARILQSELSKELNKTVIIKYQLGAGGEVAASQVARNSDSNTVLLLQSTVFIVNNSSNNPNYNWKTDFKHVAWLGHSPMVLVANNRWSGSKLNDFKVSKLNNFTYGSSGINSSTHINGVLLSQFLDKDLLHVPHSGTSAVIPSLLGHHIDFAFNFVSVAMPYIEAKQLIPLAVLNDRRISSLPNVPTFQELGAAQPWLRTWFMLLANKNAPAQDVHAVQVALQSIISRPTTQQTLHNIGFVIDAGQLSDPRTKIDMEIKKYSIIQKAMSISK